MPCHSLPQGIFPTKRSKLSLLHRRWILLSEPPGKPKPRYPRWQSNTNKCQEKQQIIEIDKNLENQFIRHGLQTALFKIVKKINGNFGREQQKNCKGNRIKILHLKNMTKFIQSSVNVLNRLVTTEKIISYSLEKYPE